MIQNKIVEALKKIVFELVNEDYKSIFKDGRNGSLSEEDIIRVLNEYGGKLTLPPDGAYLSDSLNIIEIKNNEIYQIEFDLWIDNEQSDLTLICKIIFKEGSIKQLIIDDIHVL